MIEVIMIEMFKLQGHKCKIKAKKSRHIQGDFISEWEY